MNEAMNAEGKAVFWLLDCPKWKHMTHQNMRPFPLVEHYQTPLSVSEEIKNWELPTGLTKHSEGPLNFSISIFSSF